MVSGVVLLLLLTLPIVVLSALAQARAESSSLYKARLRSKIAGSVAKGERRAAERQSKLRESCISCNRPPTLCLCNVLPEQKYVTKTRLLILQHPNERRKKNVSTVPLLRLVLENVQVVVGYTFEPTDLLPVKELLERGGRPLLLYPSEDATSLDRLSEFHPSGEATEIRVDPVNSNGSGVDDQDNLLIVMDGTWTEAKRMVRDSPLLVEQCQAVKFSSDASSIYDALRKEPEEHCLSTLEACAKVLTLLGPSSTTQSATDHLQTVLQAHVDAHLLNSQIMEPRSVGAAKAALFAKDRRRREIESTMFEEGSTNIIDTKYHHETLPDGAILRSLQASDAPLVDSWWDYSSSKSLPLVKRRIDIDQASGGGGCYGIEVKGKLVSCIMRYEGGALGMMHTHTDFRRRRYGLTLLRHATKMLTERGDERVAFIVDGNTASEALFATAGWKRADPNKKGGTGKRRAKRKWVHR